MYIILEKLFGDCMWTLESDDAGVLKESVICLFFINLSI